MSDLHDRVAERMAMALVGDAYAYQIMAKKRVRAISGGEDPTIEHYRLALEKCIEEKAADWRAACDAAAAASKAVGDLNDEITSLRLTDAEREALERLCEAVTEYAADDRKVNGERFAAGDEAAVAVVRGFLARHGGAT